MADFYRGLEVTNTTVGHGVVPHNNTVANSWQELQNELKWLIPAIIFIVVLLALISLGLFYCIRGTELWLIECCGKHCGCCTGENSHAESVPLKHAMQGEVVYLEGLQNGKDELSVKSFTPTEQE